MPIEDEYSEVIIMRKKISVICYFVLLLIIIAGCSRKIPFPFHQQNDHISRIEIVDAESCFEYTVLKSLSNSEMNEFLLQLKEIDFYTFIGSPMEMQGNAVKITYTDGNYEMISSNSVKYVKDGIVKHATWQCDKESFDELISMYR